MSTNSLSQNKGKGTRESPASSPCSSGSSQLPGPGKCVVCKKSTYNKPTVQCCLCSYEFHTGCMPEWADIVTNSDLKFIKRPGLTWYCSTCKPKLPDYLPIKPIEDTVQALATEVRNMAKLVSETLELHKTTSSTTSQPNIELRDITVRVEKELLQAKTSQQKSERSLNAILHKLEEANRTTDDIMEISNCLSFHPSSITKIQRLGQRNMNSNSTVRARPVRITFSSELNRNEFLRRYNSWDDKQSTFVTPDLSPEERDREFRLRQKRRVLTEENPQNKYQVRNGKIMVKAPETNTWSAIKPDIVENVPTNK